MLVAVQVDKPPQDTVDWEEQAKKVMKIIRSRTAMHPITHREGMNEILSLVVFLKIRHESN